MQLAIHSRQITKENANECNPVTDAVLDKLDKKLYQGR